MPPSNRRYGSESIIAYRLVAVGHVIVDDLLVERQILNLSLIVVGMSKSTVTSLSQYQLNRLICPIDMPLARCALHCQRHRLPIYSILRDQNRNSLVRQP